MSAPAIPVETQHGIAAWSVATFGAAPNDFRVITRANEELAELLRTIGADMPPEAVIEEAADVAIVLANLAERQEMPLYPPPVPSYAAAMGVGTKYLASWIALNMATAMMALAESVLDDGALIDVMQGLAEICARAGGKLGEAVDAKMVINRKRQWKPDGWAGAGTGYHVRVEPVCPAHDGTGALVVGEADRARLARVEMAIGKRRR